MTSKQAPSFPQAVGAIPGFLRSRRLLPLRWLLVVAWVAILVWQMVVREPTGLAPLAHLFPFGLDKVLHAGAFAVLAALLLVACWPTMSGIRLRTAAVWTVCLALGGLTEMAQFYVPPRDVSVGDVAADVVGATVVVALAWVGGRLGRDTAAR